MPKGYIRVFVWLSHIFRKTAFRSYKVFLAVIRLFRRCEVVSGGKERVFRERGLALSSQPTDQTNLPPPVSLTLAVPPQSEDPWSQPGTGVQPPTFQQVNEGSNCVAFDTKSPQNIIASLASSSMPEPNIPIQLQPVASGQSIVINLTPIIPTEVKRYSRNIPVSDDDAVFEIKKGHLGYNEQPAPEMEWQALTHPEGALFFYHPYKRVFTDANVRDSRTATKVSRAAEKAYKEAHKADVTLPTSVELGLELMPNDDSTLGYYFANHDKRVVFWFEDYESHLLMSNVRGVEHESHIRYAVESEYWFATSYLLRFMRRDIDRRHIELFPNNRFLPRDDVVRLKQIVMHAQAENITSDTSLAPFSPDDIANMLTLMDPLMSSIDLQHEHSVWIVARLMRLFCNSKFVNFCGQPGARLDADQSLHGDPSDGPKNIILRVMNIIMFGSPDAHSKALHRIWVDESIVQPRWKNFIDRLNNEWNGFTIFSTVMLAVDISFLAVPSVQGQTAANLVAYLSTLCAMGSLVVSLVLAGQVNDTRRNNAKGVALFMVQMSQSMLGLESLALMLSLPFALLIWGMTFFGAALAILIFHTSGIVTISVISPIWAAIVILAMWPALAANDIHLTQLRSKILRKMLGTDSPV
ncbi:hypothetical protein AZE42_06851 [Rhizopogon vesiculosus]|uniref:WW domain-containing protein n=1 Tax=Rhizopogon vesiculosus TaxID=180088 RepID=A0A1J8PK62_9AGAM|nr:hypothetical protein AZE42_06851 [Rhizopogon vesiculosus]